MSRTFSSRRLVVCGLLSFGLLLAAGPARADEPVQAMPIGLRLIDTAGQIHQLGDRDGTRAVVLAFITPQQPLAFDHIQQLNELASRFQNNGIEFYGAIADPGLSRAEAVKYCQNRHVEFTVLFDPNGTLATACQPSQWEETLVIDRDGSTIYRGPVDGRKSLDCAEHRPGEDDYLLRVLTGVVEGQKPSYAEAPSRPLGFPLPSQVTYSEHVAPILFARCAGCHRPGEVAPFSLLSYDDAAKRAEFIAEVTGKRIMPPWHVRGESSHFRNERRLSDREVAVLAAWAKAGALRGDDAELPPQPKFPEGWQLGKPDMVLGMQEAYTVPAAGPDKFIFFVIPIDIPEDKVVSAVEFRPGNPRVVHHSVMFLDASGVARQRDAATPEPGYENSTTGGFRSAGTLGFWAPGYTPRFLPRGVTQRLAKGTDLAMQLHYHPSGKEETDRSQVGVYFADKPTEKIVGGLALINFDVDIPAGKSRHKMRMSFKTPVAIDLMDVTPHMHMIGTEMNLKATLPDGSQQPLVSADWNFNWQEQYLYREPVHLPAGTKIELEAWYDNSASNPYNPNHPPARVTFGEMTTDEMCICAFRTIDDADSPTRPLLEKAIRSSIQAQLMDPRVMNNVMQLVARGTPKGEKPNLGELFGGEDPRDGKDARPAGDKR